MQMCGSDLANSEHSEENEKTFGEMATSTDLDASRSRSSRTRKINIDNRWLSDVDLFEILKDFVEK